uniref:Uncharacterized protein n=1 Tax=Rhizophora mucronata TaxID=61149 RepID=A0A2P2QUT1_RHIMU
MSFTAIGGFFSLLVVVVVVFLFNVIF